MSTLCRMMTAAMTLAPQEEQDMTEANARWAAGCLNHEGHIRTRVVQGEEGWAVEVYDDAAQGSDEDASAGERRRREARRGADGEGGPHPPRGGVEGVEHSAWIEAIDRLAADHRGTGDRR